MSFYNTLSIAQLQARIKRLESERANLPPERSGEASNYYAPAILYSKSALTERIAQAKRTAHAKKSKP